MKFETKLQSVVCSCHQLKSLAVVHTCRRMRVLVLVALAVASVNAVRMMKAGMAKDGAMTIVDVPRPTPGPKELLVRVRATAVNRAGAKTIRS